MEAALQGAISTTDFAQEGGKARAKAKGKKRAVAAKKKPEGKKLRKHSAVGKTIKQGEEGGLYYTASGRRHYIHVR